MTAVSVLKALTATAQAEGTTEIVGLLAKTRLGMHC